eukprot:CAMPEP_0196744816 /NCGR_PEP_ID=MMETSP1091-20130531/59034_1 /TAXON_ID=302021 /ORGANISM="Rhodomonas sp., Strain CCMP768" /LENGTH=176 /DNA_ID=CAMNT_0042091451 /DNA_START=38 /DNA_END=565 /DNA_ORIENTATION=+
MSTPTNAQLQALITALEAKVAAQDVTISNMVATATTDANAHTDELARDLDISWLIVCGALVFFMQAGFSMLEAGAIGAKNVVNILFKNMMDGSVAAICFWLLGYGFAYGDTVGGFIGNGNFALDGIYNGAGEGGSDGWEGWFFQWAFAGTAATIVSGSVAEEPSWKVGDAYEPNAG